VNKYKDNKLSTYVVGLIILPTIFAE